MISNSIVLLDYDDSGVAYLVSSDDLSIYGKYKANRIGCVKPVGYAVHHRGSFFSSRKFLCGLFVLKDSIYFLLDGISYDVTEECWSLERHKDSFFSYTLTLKNSGKCVASVKYREFARTQPGDPDACFFVDAIHWMSDSENKENLIKYWKGELA